MDINTRIQLAKENLRKAEQAKTVAETQKAEAEKRLSEVVEEMAKLGVTPDTIQDEISRLQSEIEAGLTKVESLMPRVS